MNLQNIHRTKTGHILTSYPNNIILEYEDDEKIMVETGSTYLALARLNTSVLDIVPMQG